MKFLNMVEPFQLVDTYNLENDTPVYQKKDYLNNNTILNDNPSFLLDENKINQNTCFYGLNTNHRERHYLYIFNYKSNTFILRDAKAKKTLKVIKLNESVYSLSFFNDSQDYFTFVNENIVKICKINIIDEKIIQYGKSFTNMIKKKNYLNKGNLIYSDDENIVTLVNGNSFNIYSTKKDTWDNFNSNI